MVKILEQTSKAKLNENERLIHRCHICSQLFAWNRQQPKLIPNHYFEHFQDQDYDIVWKALANTPFLDSQLTSNVWKKCNKGFNHWEEIEIYLALKHGVLSQLLIDNQTHRPDGGYESVSSCDMWQVHIWEEFLRITGMKSSSLNFSVKPWEKSKKVLNC